MTKLEELSRGPCSLVRDSLSVLTDALLDIMDQLELKKGMGGQQIFWGGTPLSPAIPVTPSEAFLHGGVPADVLVRYQIISSTGMSTSRLLLCGIVSRKTPSHTTTMTKVHVRPIAPMSDSLITLFRDMSRHNGEGVQFL
jgi:hypothetical protein